MATTKKQVEGSDVHAKRLEDLRARKEAAAGAGCEIFVAEAYVRALDGPPNPTRLPDEDTGLALWG